ncbi:MAG: site-specific integrase, partial [Hyphomonas sp.]
MDMLAAFLDHLTRERRMATKTVEAYGSDLRFFLAFLRLHMWGEPSPKMLAEVRARDIRAYLAERRREGLSDASVARILSSIKALYRWLDRAHQINNAEVGYLQGPRRPQRLPRPVSIDAASDLIAEAENEPDQEPWIGARDAAVLSLLYGGGLRISEALSLTGAHLPAPERLRVNGKGGKVRIVPLIPAVREAIHAYADICPYALTREGPLF